MFLVYLRSVKITTPPHHFLHNKLTSIFHLLTIIRHFLQKNAMPLYDDLVLIEYQKEKSINKKLQWQNEQYLIH